MPRSPSTRVPALLRAAAKVREHAHAPYSHFPVGAAVLAGGRIFAGCNVENSAYPLSVCAERNAIAAAVAAGFKRIDAVAVVGGHHRPSAPCGGCRQVLAEFAAPGTPVVYATEAGQTIATTLGALLPSAFTMSDVTAAAPVSRGSRQGTRSRAASDKDRSAARVRGTRNSGR
jgi:cytidine deaminase